MKERPILFSAPMVRAILEGRKTQTRRVVKRSDGELPLDFHDGMFWFADGDAFEMDCPYGKPGDRLWVRETWAVVHGVPHADGPHPDDFVRYRADGEAGDKVLTELRCWKPSIHMPRVYSRITLEITEVRVQRLQEISEEDAKSEGVEPLSMTEEDIADTQISDRSPDEKELARLMGPGSFSHKFTYQMLWDEINGARSWDANPWVWAITFKQVQP